MAISLPPTNKKTFLHATDLLRVWTGREIKSRYRQSVLGLGWVVIQPLMQMIVLAVVFGQVIRVPSEGIPYPIFVYTALIPWTLFAGSITAAFPSIINNMDLVTKIYFPRETLPLSAILARLVDFAIAFVIYLGMMLWYGFPITPLIAWVPVLLLIQLTLTFGIGLFGAAVSVFLRDFSFAIPIGMQLWMYATPIIYPLTLVPEGWRSLYLLNPMAGLIEAYRDVLLRGQAPNLTYLGLTAFVSFTIFILAYIFFKRVEMSMADII